MKGTAGWNPYTCPLIDGIISQGCGDSRMAVCVGSAITCMSLQVLAHLQVTATLHSPPINTGREPTT